MSGLGVFYFFVYVYVLYVILVCVYIVICLWFIRGEIVKIKVNVLFYGVGIWFL